MNSKKMIYVGVALLVAGIATAIGTYAYYSTTITGTVTGTVLAWQCTAENKGEGQAFSVSLGSNMYPGMTDGSKSITIASTIDADYEVKFTNLQHIGTGSDRAGLKMYKEAGHTTEIVDNSTITGSVTGGGTATPTIYFSWPYGSEESYVTAAPSATITVTCTQK